MSGQVIYFEDLEQWIRDLEEENEAHIVEGLREAMRRSLDLRDQGGTQ